MSALGQRGLPFTWVECIHGIDLVPSFGGALREEAWPFEHQALIRGRTTLNAGLKDFDLCRDCTDGIARNAIRPLVPDAVMLQFEINKHQGPPKGSFEIVNFDEFSTGVECGERCRSPLRQYFFEDVSVF